jgi:DNA polymerase I-like protein with 3'-5' exonuclease and polymerase domains
MATSGVEREGKNTPIQAVNADVAKLALYYAHCEFPYGGPVKLVNIIHDEINAESPPDMADFVTRRIKELMEKAGNEIINGVPILADAAHGSDWSVK